MNYVAKNCASTKDSNTHTYDKEKLQQDQCRAKQRVNKERERRRRVVNCRMNEHKLKPIAVALPVWSLARSCGVLSSPRAQRHANFWQILKRTHTHIHTQLAVGSSWAVSDAWLSITKERHCEFLGHTSGQTGRESVRTVKDIRSQHAENIWK